MSALVETAIWLALKGRIESLPLPLSKAWPGETFELPSAAGQALPYLRIARVMIAPQSVMIDYGKRHDRIGTLMVTLVAPLGQNVSVHDQTAATIAQHFADGTQMRFGAVCVTVNSFPHVQEGYEENGYWTVPVAIPWRCFA